MSKPVSDVLVIGASPAGAALFYQLARFTNLGSIRLLDASDLGRTSLADGWSSQALQYGYVDTTCTLAQARNWHRSASMVTNYALRHSDAGRMLVKCPKMAVAFGESNTQWLRERFETFKPHFPMLEWWERSDIAELEPHVVLSSEGGLRPEPMAAIGTTNQFTLVNTKALVASLLDDAINSYDKTVSLQGNTRVLHIEPHTVGYRVRTDKGDFLTRYLVGTAGLASLGLAQGLGLGADLAIEPMNTVEFRAHGMVRGRVLTAYTPDTPATILSAEPDMEAPGKMRIRITEAAKDQAPGRPVALDKDILNQAQGLIPTLSLSHVSRVQPPFEPISYVLDSRTGQQLEEGITVSDDGVRFHIQSSVHVTSCLSGAYLDLCAIQEKLGCSLDDVRLKAQLMTDPRTIYRGRAA